MWQYKPTTQMKCGSPKVTLTSIEDIVCTAEGYEQSAMASRAPFGASRSLEWLDGWCP